MDKKTPVKIDVPARAKKILGILHDAGHEAYVVGGCVRDSLLGREPEDWDITTSALPNEVKSLFFHTVDTGIQHGTVMVLMGGDGYEVTTYRKDGTYSDCRRPDDVEFTPSLAEDLKRRDFTINALAYNDEAGLVDLFDGLKDLEEGLIRCVGDPDRRFSEDALRIMRAVRFAAQLSYEIESATYQAIRDHAENLAKISMERIRVEFEKTLMSGHPEYVNQFKELGLSEYILRDAALASRCFREDSADLCRQFREEDGKQALKYLRLAAFFKEASPEDAAFGLRRLTYDNRTKNMVRDILRFKDRPVPADRRYIRQALRVMGPEVFSLVIAYKTAELHAGDLIKVGEMRCFEMRDEQMLSDVKELTEEIIKSHDPYKISMLDVNGNDIINEGIAEGAEIGNVLEHLLDLVISDPSKNQKEVLLKHLKEQ